MLLICWTLFPAEIWETWKKSLSILGQPLPVYLNLVQFLIFDAIHKAFIVLHKNWMFSTTFFGVCTYHSSFFWKFWRNAFFSFFLNEICSSWKLILGVFWQVSGEKKMDNFFLSGQLLFCTSHINSKPENSGAKTLWKRATSTLKLWLQLIDQGNRSAFLQTCAVRLSKFRSWLRTNRKTRSTPFWEKMKFLFFRHIC